jgi:phosphatidylglycerol---prolipoprotein diacylglyceryl transferase
MTSPRLAYALFMGLAMGVFLLARRCVPRPPRLTALPWWKRFALGVAAFVGGSLGAKVPFAFGASGGWWTPEAWLTDGKTLVAGLCFAYLAVEITKLALDIRVKTGDTFALPLALAMVVGRLGCLFNGCCYGTPTNLPWGVRFGHPDGLSMVRHPTQIYESLFHLAMAVVLLELLWHGWLRGHHLQLYLIAYGVYRFLTEFIRPEPKVLLGLTFYQWGAIVLVAAMVTQWVFEEWRRGAVEDDLSGVPEHGGVARDVITEKIPN